MYQSQIEKKNHPCCRHDDGASALMSNYHWGSVWKPWEQCWYIMSKPCCVYHLDNLDHKFTVNLTWDYEVLVVCLEHFFTNSLYWTLDLMMHIYFTITLALIRKLHQWLRRPYWKPCMWTGFHEEDPSMVLFPSISIALWKHFGKSYFGPAERFGRQEASFFIMGNYTDRKQVQLYKRNTDVTSALAMVTNEF